MNNNKINRGKKVARKRFGNDSKPTKDYSETNAGSEKKYHAPENDVAWYTKSPALLDAAASLPYSYPVGGRIDLTNSLASVWDAGSPFRSFSGILALDVLVGPGVSVDGDSAVNIAARDIYSYVRYANSGHSNYDPQDLMMYFLAWDEVSMWIENAKRAYKCMFTYNTQNRYAPRYLVRALGFDYADINANLAQFRYAINALIARFNALNVPTQFSYFTRHKWLYSNIYTDSTTAKAQLYLYRPTLVRKYVETGANGGALKIAAVLNSDSKLMTFSRFVSVSNTLIDALLGSEDIGIMSGDILKAFGSDKCWVTAMVGEAESLIPVYNMEVLSQVQNATVLGTKAIVDESTDFDITQDPTINKGWIIYNPHFSHNSASVLKNTLGNRASNANRVITLNITDPKPGDTMVATRLACITKDADESSTSVKFDLYTAGDTVCTNAHVYEVRYGTDEPGLATYDVSINMTMGAPVAYIGRTSLLSLASLSNFDYHPMATVHFYDTGASDASFVKAVFFDVDNYTIVNPDVLQKINETAILAEFDIPISTKVTGKI